MSFNLLLIYWDGMYWVDIVLYCVQVWLKAVTIPRCVFSCRCRSTPTQNCLVMSPEGRRTGRQMVLSRVCCRQYVRVQEFITHTHIVSKLIYLRWPNEYDILVLHGYDYCERQTLDSNPVCNTSSQKQLLRCSLLSVDQAVLPVTQT